MFENIMYYLLKQFVNASALKNLNFYEWLTWKANDIISPY